MARQARGPSTAARQARGPSAVARQARERDSEKQFQVKIFPQPPPLILPFLYTSLQLLQKQVLRQFDTNIIFDFPQFQMELID